MSYSFTEKHRPWAGTVTNCPKYTTANGGPHASTVVCARPECQVKAKAWVAAKTNEAAVFVPYAVR